PRDLHSFPTRRSSDLSRSASARPGSGPKTQWTSESSIIGFIGLLPRAPARRAPIQRKANVETTLVPGFASVRGQDAARPSYDGRDRKSTRLNSSHVEI